MNVQPDEEQDVVKTLATPTVTSATLMVVALTLAVTVPLPAPITKVGQLEATPWAVPMHDMDRVQLLLVVIF